MANISTPHLRFQQLSRSQHDVDFIHQLYNSDRFKQNIADKHLSTKRQTLHYIESGPMTMYDEMGYGLWKVSLTRSAQAIGVCGLLKRGWLAYPDIGFALLQGYEGQGYGFEAAQATVLWARENLSDKNILAIVKKENSRSVALLKKLGFTFSRVVEEPESGSPLNCFQLQL